MGIMPRLNWPHLQKRITRHGKVTWYVRLGRGPLVRLRATHGTPEFEAAYHAALRGERTSGQRGSAAGTLRWLVERYKDSESWRQLATGTRRQRDYIFAHVLTASGTKPAASVTRADVLAGRDRRADTPYQAQHFLAALRGLFRWALAAQLIHADPTAGVENPAKRKGGGFPPWTEDDVTAYLHRWPAGTKEHVWLAVLLYTGLRRGDAVRLGRQHVRDGVAALTTEKTGTPVTIPLQPALLAALAAGPTGDLAYICGERREPLTKDSFGSMFRTACRAAGIRKSAHGLRKLAATRVAQNGGSWTQLNALFGWTGTQMAAHYTRAVERERLAREAGHLLNTPATTFPEGGSSGLKTSYKSTT